MYVNEVTVMSDITSSKIFHMVNGQKPSGQKPSRQKMTRRTKALPWKWQGGQEPSRENDRADKSPPIKMTGRTKALTWNWQGGQKPSRNKNKYVCWIPVFFQCTQHLIEIITYIFVAVFNWPKYLYELEPPFNLNIPSRNV
jgi:hypothetical protein